MKALSLFSGVGGFDLALERAGHEIVAHSEIDKYADQIYSKHFSNPNLGDITKIDTAKLPDFDILVGGTPCQDMSIAGKRKGLKGNRSGLFSYFVDVIKQKKPKYFIWENVKGALSSNQGWDFAEILDSFSEVGYDVEWEVLNSKNFGVPQNRERVFVVGYSRGESRPKVFPLGETTLGTIKVSKRGKHQQDIVYRTDGIMATLAAGTHASTKHLTKIEQINQPKHSNDRIYDPKGISPTLNTMQGGNRQPFIKEKMNIRRLTPIEAERLQNFPDNWTEGISSSQRYKSLGNAVTVSVISAILKKL